MKMLYVNARGMIVECITPGVKIGGEVTRAILLKKEMNYSGSEAASLVTLQKVISLSAFFLINVLALLGLSSRVEFLQDSVVRFMVYLFILSILAVFACLFLFDQKLDTKVRSWTPQRNWLHKLEQYLLLLFEHVAVLKSTRGELSKQLMLSVIIWLLFPAKMLVLVSLFAANYDPLFIIGVTFISYMISMIPLLPGGLGSFEATMTALLLLMNLPVTDAVTITILFRFITFWFVILLSIAFSGVWKLRQLRGSLN
ncbi:MAG TPA: flippase-like domain-containing protein [Clostridiaceae bacterium]|nr:flippase-like domain-containing protein [Clostridiaceae bacterium]